MATTFMPAAKGSARTPLGPFAFVCMLISVLIIEEKLLTKNILDKSFEHLITETVFNFSKYLFSSSIKLNKKSEYFELIKL